MRAVLALCASLCLGAFVVTAAAPRDPFTLDRAAERWVEQTRKALTPDEKIGQLIVPSYESNFLSTDSDTFEMLTRLVRETLERQLASGDVQAIITTGGTGITSRDSTYEVVDRLLHKRLDGFGELFRMLSFQQIGPAAMMSRACAGIADGHIVVSLPGSEAAVRLAMERLVIPELGHLVEQARR